MSSVRMNAATKQKLIDISILLRVGNLRHDSSDEDVFEQIPLLIQYVNQKYVNRKLLRIYQ